MNRSDLKSRVLKGTHRFDSDPGHYQIRSFTGLAKHSPECSRRFQPDGELTTCNSLSARWSTLDCVAANVDGVLNPPIATIVPLALWRGAGP